MNKQQKLTALFLALSLSAGSAHAAGSEKPASQFGFKGWPYRQQIICPTPSPEPGTAPVPTAAPPSPTAVPNATKAPQATQQPQATTTPPANDDDYTTPSISTQEEIAFNLLNQDRIANGLPALRLDAALCDIARIKCQDMYDNGYFSHNSPTYGSPSQMLRHFGYSFTSVAENIAHHATVEKAQAAFLSSEGHRRNLLGSQWNRAGVGVWTDAQGYVYVTQLFAR